MSDTYEKGSNNGSNGGNDAGYILDARRRAALAEVDNAKFSYALITTCQVCLPDI